MIAMSTVKKTTTTQCYDCRKITNHKILHCKQVVEIETVKRKKTKTFSDYMIVQCSGCDEINFLLRYSGKQFIGDDGNDYIDINFPYEDDELDYDISLLSRKEQLGLPKLLRDLYEEIEGAFIDDLKILAGVGLRMLIEALCLEQMIKGKNLQEKIKNLHLSGLISANEVPILDKLRLIGNFSAHEVRGLSIGKLEYALDIVNHVLKSIYVLPKINKKLII
jgi:hypothetical protein